MEINHIKRKIYESILKGEIGTGVIESLVLKTGKIVPKECVLWDYKREFSGDNASYLKTLKSIVSFYNTFGGYIIYGVDELEKDTTFQIVGIKNKNCIDQQMLRGAFDKHFGRRLDITYQEFLFSDQGVSKRLGLLHVPKRPQNEHSASVVKNGVIENKPILEKDFTYFRSQDECKQVKQSNDFEFISSDRDFLVQLGMTPSSRKKIIDHNLPDKNFICPRFIGRFNIIQELWAWFGDEFQYYKVLAGEGGKGKTSIAYEFSQLLAKSGSSIIEQIIWVTAKKKQFKALHNSYVSTPETHYSDLKSLLEIICLKTGSLESEITGCEENQLKRIAKMNLETYPSLIVVDDVDTNSPDEQRRIMESARLIANSNSRVLLTTRVNNIYSSDSCIQVPGLEGEEYKKFVITSCDFLNLQVLNVENIERLRVASEGSPLFTDSILRLYKRGMSLQKAIKEWQGKTGEEAREAALRKEIEELSTEAIQVLLTLSYVGACSVTEIQQLTELHQTSIDDAIEQLGNLFLLQGQKFIQNEARIETLASVSTLVLSISEELLPNAKNFIQDIHDITEGLRASDEANGKLPEVGSAIRQSNALLKNRRYSDARSTVSSLLNDLKFKDNTDLLFMLARVEYTDPESEFKVVRKAFNHAYIKGQRKELFFSMWFEIEKQSLEKQAVFNVCKAAINEGCVQSDVWFERYSNCCEEQADIVINFERKIELLVNAYEYASKAMKVANGNRWHNLKEQCIRIVDNIWRFALVEENYVIGFNAIKNAVDNGDIRGLNYSRVAEVMEKVKAKLSVINKNKRGDLLGLLGDIEQYASNSLIQLGEEVNPRLVVIDRLHSAIDIATVD
jgi:hypothetical protein